MYSALTLTWALAIAAPTTGTITGKVMLEEGLEIKAPEKIVPTTDAAICSQQDLVDESLLADPKTRGVRNVAIWVEGTKAPKLESAPVIDNFRCRYEPHVLIVPEGTEVIVRNRDRFLHTSQA